MRAGFRFDARKRFQPFRQKQEGVRESGQHSRVTRLFRQPTTFIIGAGASYELGLPLGEGLKGSIADILNIRYDYSRQISGDYQIAQECKAASQENSERSWDNYIEACWLLRDALPAAISIDNLMDAHQGNKYVELVGKMAIVKSIWEAERESALFPIIKDSERFEISAISSSWLIPFFQILTENVKLGEIEDLFQNVSFIVFNYDRCLETFLPHALRNYYGIEINEAHRIAEKAVIIHPYGSVGDTVNPRNPEHIPFGTDQKRYRNQSSNIRTFSEGLMHETHGDKIKKILKLSHQVIFLGFAFHPLNMEILTIDEDNFIRKVFATTLKLATPAQRTVETEIKRIFNKPLTGRPDFQGHNKCLDELNLSGETAHSFLNSYFRGIA